MRTLGPVLSPLLSGWPHEHWPALWAWEVSAALGALPGGSLAYAFAVGLSVSNRESPWPLIRSGT